MNQFRQLFSIILLCLLYSGINAQNSNVVTDGNARFTVLTPTLIRMEYSGDGVFDDKSSFNITNLDLPFPSYSTVENAGWLEIQTDDLLLQYKQNSGIFDSTNVMVSFNMDDQVVVSKPWTLSKSGYKNEAENATLFGGASIESNHDDYGGSGFVAGLTDLGAGFEWALNRNLIAGEYVLSLRYSNGMGEPRSISLYVDGQKTQITLDNTSDWDTWKIHDLKVDLDQGPHTFKVVCENTDNYHVNIDWLALVPVMNFNEICEAENATLSGNATEDSNHSGFSGSGFVAGLDELGSSIAWELNNDLAEGDYNITLRYTNGLAGDGQHTARTLSLFVDGVKSQISVPATNDWADWSTFQKSVNLGTGPHTIKLSCEEGDTYHVNVDWIAVSPFGEDVPETIVSEDNMNIGGWVRSLDLKSGGVPLWDGLMSKAGWYLIDDSRTALVDESNWVVGRPLHEGGYQDGYFFGYGNDYKTALSDFYKITGNPLLLPKWVFGVWYSKYHDYSTSDYQNNVLPKFRSNKVPLDVLVVDTDWKSPSTWDGWNWNTSSFPDPQGFLDWTKEQGLKVTLNIHPTIQENDPKFDVTNSTAGGLDGQGIGLFDFSDKNHAQAYFDLHQPFNEQGVRFWWLDWCSRGTKMSVAGTPGDTWVNSLYVKDATDQGLRGFAFSRIGAGFTGYADLGVEGTAWSDHRYTIHFTGDTYDTWEMLKFASVYTIKEANVGIPYVSHDLGSFHGDKLSDDMYVRWVQFGTFQPIFRLHSDHGWRLPWHYPEVQEYAQDFIRLRHALVPYVYSLAYKSSQGGLPLVRGLYYDYPNAEEAYSFDSQYLFGDNILVSPVVTGGEVTSTNVWFPEGNWVNFFTNRIITGPGSRNVVSNYNSMPVFVKEGGIIPMAPYSDYIGQTAEDSLLFRIYAGADGEFALYQDEGDNLEYQNGAFAQTTVEYIEQDRKVTIYPQQGDYQGAPVKRSYDVAVYNADLPETVYLNGNEMDSISAHTGHGWWVKDGIIHVHIGKTPVTDENVITFEGVVTDIPEDVDAEKISVYPNPTSDAFTISTTDAFRDANVSICNMNGETVYSDVVSGDNEISIETHGFKKGAYIVMVKNGDVFFKEKLIVE